MAEERVDIVLVDKIDPTIIPKMQQMVTLAQQLQVSMGAAGTQMRSMRAPTAAVASSMSTLNTQVKKTNSSFISMGQTLRIMFQLYFAYAAAQRILSMADAFKTLENRVSLVTDTAEQQRAVLLRLFSVAQESRAPVSATVTAFQRFDLAMQEMGRSQEDTIALTRTVNQMLLLTGSTSSEARSGMLQLSQAFNKGKLDGDEFRTVMEVMPLVAKAMQKEFNVTKKELYDMSRAGRLTAKDLADGILSVAEETQVAFNDLDMTLEQAIENLQTEAIMQFGLLNDEMGGTDGLVSLVKDLTDNIAGLVVGLEMLAAVIGDVLRPIRETENMMRDNSFLKMLGVDELPGFLDTIAMLKQAEDEAARRGGNWSIISVLMDPKFSEGVKTFAELVELRKKMIEDAKDADLRGKRAVDETMPFDLKYYDKYLAKLDQESAIMEANANAMFSYARMLELLKASKAELNDLTSEELRAGIDTIHANERWMVTSREALKIYNETILAMEELGWRHDALRMAYEVGAISQYEYLNGYYALQAELIRTQEIMGETLGLTDMLKLAFFQLGEDIGRPIQEMADIFTSAMERMTSSVGDLVAQWAVFGEAMRFIDVFRAFIAQVIQQLVALTAQYIIVGIARRFAGLPPLFSDGGGSGAGHSVAGNPTGMGQAIGYQPPVLPSSGFTSGGMTGAPNVIVNNYTSAGVAVERDSSGALRLTIREEIAAQTPGVVAAQVADPNSKVSRSLRQHTTANRKGA